MEFLEGGMFKKNTLKMCAQSLDRDFVLIFVNIYKNECSKIRVKGICENAFKGVVSKFGRGKREKSFAMDLKLLLFRQRFFNNPMNMKHGNCAVYTDLLTSKLDQMVTVKLYAF